MIIKVIYFDENSATDCIYICEGGKKENTSEEIAKKTKGITAGATAKVKSKFNFFSFFKSSAGAEIAGEYGRESEDIIKKAISNTILTDYIELANSAEMKEHIIQFKNCRLYPYPESFAYFKMLTPYMAMTEGDLSLGDNLKLNVALMDKAFETARGYYELIADDEENKVILRFNINAFRNNYSISDLVKMNLHYYAIEVGKISEQSLAMQNEFSKNEKEISGYELIDPGTYNTMLKVYDVVLAGIDK